MLPHEIVKRRTKYPVAFTGLGVLEWHGEHQAVGLDGLKAERLCELAAKKSGGFAMPTLWYGEPRSTALMEATVDGDNKIKSTMGFKKNKFTEKFWNKTSEEQIEFYQSLLMHFLTQMNTLEMKVIILLCGHYPLREFAEPVVDEYNRLYPESIAFASAEPEFDETGFSKGDHASTWETSYLWYLRPDCVDMSTYQGRKDEPLTGVKMSGKTTTLNELQNTASIERGRKSINNIVNGILKKADQLYQEVQDHKRSAT